MIKAQKCLLSIVLFEYYGHISLLWEPMIFGIIAILV